MMDQNEDVNKRNGITQTLEINSSMQNIATIFGLHHIPTYKRSNNQMDTIMVSTGLQQYIHAFQMHPFDHICPSDHRSMYLDIDLSKYYKDTKSINRFIPRGISSKHTKQLNQYKQLVYDGLHTSHLKKATEEIHNKL